MAAVHAALKAHEKYKVKEDEANASEESDSSEDEDTRNHNLSMYDEVIEEVAQTVKKQKQTRDNYSALCVWLAYFLLYTTVLIMQRDPVDAFEIEQTLKDVILTPESGIVDKSTGELNPRFMSGDDIYTFLRATVNTLYKTEKCGNGICEVSESKFYNGLGCLADCGKWANVTKVNISVWNEQSWHDSNNELDDLEDENGRDLYLCEENTHYCLLSGTRLKPSSNFTKSFELYDGIWSLRAVPDMHGIGGIANVIEVDSVKTKQFNETVFAQNAPRNLTQYRNSPKIFYKSTVAVYWPGCKPANLPIQSSQCTSVTDKYGDVCDSNNLGDGYCDNACNNEFCNYDDGDCCAPFEIDTLERSFKLFKYGGEDDEVQVFGATKNRINQVFIGGDGTNRVIGGLLVTQTHKKMEKCTEQSHVSYSTPI